LSGRLGPFVCTEQRDALSLRWSARGEEDPEKPGRHRFLVTDENAGLFTPGSPAAETDAWRAAIDSLSDNDFFEDVSVTRLIRAAVGARGLEAGSVVHSGDVVDLELELRSPHATEQRFPPLLVSDPEGAAELLDPEAAEQLPGCGNGHVQVRLLEPG